MFYLAARTLSSLAVQIQSVAVGWQLYASTGKVMDLGWIGLAQFAPFFVLVLPAGQVADRFDRRKIILSCGIVQMLSSLILLAYSAANTTNHLPVYLALVLFGGARAFLMPASQAFLTNIVPKASFGQAVAINSSVFHATVILGPILGGLLYNAAGPVDVYTLVSVSFAFSIMLLFLVRLRTAPATREPVSLSGVLEGFRFVGSRPIVLGALSLDLFAVLFGGAVALLPAYAQDVLHTDSFGLGLLRTAPGVGAVLTAAVLSVKPITRHVGLWMFGGVAVFGLATIVLGLSRDLTLAAIALAATGAGDQVSVYVRHILVQLETPDAIRGRVSAVNSVFIGASNELGEFESGVAAWALGLLPSIVTGGLATLAVTALWAWLFPSLSRMDQFPHTKPSSET
jgi:MFS family permease